MRITTNILPFLCKGREKENNSLGESVHDLHKHPGWCLMTPEILNHPASQNRCTSNDTKSMHMGLVNLYYRDLDHEISTHTTCWCTRNENLQILLEMKASYNNVFPLKNYILQSYLSDCINILHTHAIEDCLFNKSRRNRHHWGCSPKYYMRTIGDP